MRTIDRPSQPCRRVDEHVEPLLRHEPSDREQRERPVRLRLRAEAAQVYTVREERRARAGLTDLARDVGIAGDDARSAGAAAT